MSIFYSHIKGMDTKGQYHYLTWQIDNNINYQVEDNDYGNIMFTNGINQDVNTVFNFKKGFKINDIEVSESGKQIVVNGALRVSGNFYIQDYLTITRDNISIKAPINMNSKNITSVDQLNAKTVTANTFNATSDRRAKQDIKPLTINALNLVKQTPVYSFNYIKNNMPSIGMIAQELADKDINDFSFITNANATGQDDDFMSIKESKLVYVLWKAVQELSAKVEELEANKKSS